MRRKGQTGEKLGLLSGVKSIFAVSVYIESECTSSSKTNSPHPHPQTRPRYILVRRDYSLWGQLTDRFILRDRYQRGFHPPKRNLDFVGVETMDAAGFFAVAVG
jgi:hypothetical protein